MAYADQIKSVKDYIKLPFVYNHWYMAGMSEDFSQTPIAKTLLNRSIVFYRTQDGTPVAMQNRCLHRSFPLSEGYMEGDNLVCRYHGIRYTPEGEIASIPCQKSLSQKKLHRYPLKEVGQFVFIWMGDETDGMEDAFPDLSHLADTNFRTFGDFMLLEGNYLLMLENLNDLSHFAYLHKDSFVFSEEFLDIPFTVEKRNGGIFCNRIDRDPARVVKTLPPHYHELAEGKPIERWDGGIAVTPGIFTGLAPTYIGAEDDPDRMVLNQIINHYVTPETESTSHYWWSMSIDYEQNNDMFCEMFKGILTTGFDEDKWAVAHMQKLLDKDHIEFDEMVIAGDQAGLLYRKVMLDWVIAEHGEAPKSA